MAKDKKLLIDMCAGSELKDTQGETLSIEGADISELEAGRGRFNDNHGKGFFNSLGRVTGAKKIFKAEDCENDRHRYYWEKIKAPYIYVIGELYNNEDHPNAKAAAAILRNIHREDTPLKMKASVEGGVIARGLKDPTRLAQTKIHSVALTFTPANNATLVEPLNIDKSYTDWESDKQLIKSVMYLAETNVPSFRHIQRHASANTIYENINKIQELAKSIGLEIEIKQTNPEAIIKKAVLSKIANNINKINELVKAVNAKRMFNVMKPTSSALLTSSTGPEIKPTTASESKMNLIPAKAQAADKQRQENISTGTDKFQQGIGQLKSDPTTPQVPKSSVILPHDAMKVQSAQKVKDINTFKSHASKAMRDPNHLNTVVSSLKQRNVPQVTIDAIVNNIKTHMQGDVQKSIVEKSDIGRAVKGLIIAGAMANAADQMVPSNKKEKNKKETAIHREIASKPVNQQHNLKVVDPDLLVGSKRKGYDERQPNAKKKFKDSIKKALMAGYGGSGAPTSLSNGGVFQTESVEDARRAKSNCGLKYIICDDCGHEQVYMKHQVKCRKCRKNFNLNKLKDFL